LLIVSRVVVILLSRGVLQSVSCEADDVFVVAKARNAGICGVFPTQADADARIYELKMEQVRNRWPSSPLVEDCSVLVPESLN
jgi:hypothetical protein